MLGGRPWAVAVALLATVGCTREVGRISLARPGSGDVTVEMSSGDVVFSLDSEYEPTGRAGSVTGLEAYRLSVTAVQGKRVAAVAVCNPLRVSSGGWSRQSSAKLVRLVGNRIADCSLSLPRGGTTTFKATLSEVRKPDVRLRYVDVLVEQ